VKSKDAPSELNLYEIPFKGTDAPSDHRQKKGVPMAGHKYRVGQILFFSPSIFEAASRKGAYRVVRLLPAEGGNNQYRLKSEADGHECVVRESQLASSW
jgi:hypothetical protein